MHDLRTLQIPKVKDGVKFEHLCRDIWMNDKGNYELVAFNGRAGQSQDGIDIFGREIESKKWFGIQCKARINTNKLKENDIRTEVNKALKFNPSLEKYTLITTLDRDKGLQEVMRLINSDTTVSFSFEILFWDDIEELLKKEENFNIYYQYYQSYFADNTTIGQSIGKLLNLDVGTGDCCDTHYELLVGKIPKYKDCKNYAADYYRGTYFIVNFHESRIETFTLPCYESDLERAFSNEYDRFLITKWLMSIENFDDFLFNQENSFKSFISIEERKKYIDSLHEND